MSSQPALTVSQAMSLAKRALEGVHALVLGEVSEVSDKPGYKAVYFTLADGDSCMPCLMWRDAYRASGVQLRPGAMVQVSGTFSAYAAKGRMQFQCRALSPAGEGMLRVQVAALARKLEAEGLMRAERKRALPAYPSRVALVTSPRGKAVHDVVRTLRRRFPSAELLIAGVAVEGACAVEAIVAGLESASASGADVVIVARGGGSYEDLMPFNAEAVARAIAECRVPVVTGIGHEPDTTIADMVADVRASTPTAAAEAAAPSAAAVGSHLGHLARRLGRGLSHCAQAASHRVGILSARPVLCRPEVLFALQAQAVDEAADGLARALPGRLTADAARLEGLGRALGAGARGSLERAEREAAHAADRLHDLSPLAILGRGYAVCFEQDGRTVVRSAGQALVGSRVHVRLGSGELGCTVETSRTEEA